MLLQFNSLPFVFNFLSHVSTKVEWQWTCACTCRWQVFLQTGGPRCDLTQGCTRTCGLEWPSWVTFTTKSPMVVSLRSVVFFTENREHMKKELSNLMVILFLFFFPCQARRQWRTVSTFLGGRSFQWRSFTLHLWNDLIVSFCRTLPLRSPPLGPAVI